MEKTPSEYDFGDIHFRDRWQFELKSEYTPSEAVKKNIYYQEFYLFIPNALQINRETYFKTNFYQDETNFIRFKTPEYTIPQLIDPKNAESPLYRVHKLLEQSPSQPGLLNDVENEIKLLANIIRSSLRASAGALASELQDLPTSMVDEFNQRLKVFCYHLLQFKREFGDLMLRFKEKFEDVTLQKHFFYVDEFISNSLYYYLTSLLEKVREFHTIHPGLSDQPLTDFLMNEQRYRKERFEDTKLGEDSAQNEYIVYRRGLLNKFVLDVLQLNTSSASLDIRFSNIIGSISAGIAMLFYTVLWVWQGQLFAFNSLAFVLLTVILYILKDRLKEILKAISYKQAARWFPDYTTKIRTADERTDVGEMHESFAFVDERSIPKDIHQMRNREFHEVLEAIKRPEQVISYKKTVIFTKIDQLPSRLKAFNVIFRLSIQRFLAKASNPFHNYLTFDSDTKGLTEIRLPKVYHLNIIMKNSYLVPDGSTKVELKKFRLIIDKSGIKHIEQPRRVAPEDTEV
jgi:hypothetical protein